MCGGARPELGKLLYKAHLDTFTKCIELYLFVIEANRVKCADEDSKSDW